MSASPTAEYFARREAVLGSPGFGSHRRDLAQQQDLELRIRLIEISLFGVSLGGIEQDADWLPE